MSNHIHIAPSSFSPENGWQSTKGNVCQTKLASDFTCTSLTSCGVSHRRKGRDCDHLLSTPNTLVTGRLICHGLKRQIIRIFWELDFHPNGFRSFFVLFCVQIHIHVRTSCCFEGIVCVKLFSLEHSISEFTLKKFNAFQIYFPRGSQLILVFSHPWGSTLYLGKANFPTL